MSVTAKTFFIFGGRARRLRWLLERKPAFEAQLYLRIEKLIDDVLTEQNVPPLEKCVLEDDTR